VIIIIFCEAELHLTLLGISLLGLLYQLTLDEIEICKNIFACVHCASSLQLV
jgi:hypothetical protein